MQKVQKTRLRSNHNKTIMNDQAVFVSLSTSTQKVLMLVRLLQSLSVADRGLSSVIGVNDSCCT